MTTRSATRPRGGRPPKTPTAAQIRQVEEMAARGLTQSDMAAILGMSSPTFRKYLPGFFATAIAKGQAVGKNTAGAALLRQVRKGNISAIIWFEKTRHGYTEKVHTVLTDPDGKALPAGGPHVAVGIFLPPNGRDVPVPGQTLPSHWPTPPTDEASSPEASE
jgi:predicted transcriptional regulator